MSVADVDAAQSLWAEFGDDDIVIDVWGRRLHRAAVAAGLTVGRRDPDA